MLGLIALLLVASGDPGQGTAKPQAGAETRDPRDELVCKRSVETGSLVRSTKICKTRRQWDSDRAAVRESRSGPGGNACRDAANGGGACF